MELKYVIPAALILLVSGGLIFYQQSQVFEESPENSTEPNLQGSSEFTDTFESELGPEYVFTIETEEINQVRIENDRTYYQVSLRFELTDFGQRVANADSEEEVEELVRNSFESYPEGDFASDLMSDVTAVQEGRPEYIQSQALTGRIEDLGRGGGSVMNMEVSVKGNERPEVKFGSFSTVWSARDAPSSLNPTPSDGETIDVFKPGLDISYGEIYSEGTYEFYSQSGDLIGSCTTEKPSLATSYTCASPVEFSSADSQGDYYWYVIGPSLNRYPSSGEYTFEINRNSPPSASFSSDSPVLTNEDFGLDASSSSDPDGDSLAYKWDTDGDGVYDDASGAFASLSKADNGNYDIGLEVADGNGGTDTASSTVEVNNRPPIASLSDDGPVRAGEPLKLNASGSSDSDGSIVQYDYDYDNDGNYETVGGSPSTTYTWSNQGFYTVVLRVTDDDGSKDTKTKSIQVLAALGSIIDNVGGVVQTDENGVIQTQP